MSILGSKPREYTIAGDGTIKKITAALDINGDAMNGGSVDANIWADTVIFQNSNVSGGEVFIGYLEDAAPATLDETNAGLDLQVGQSEPYPKSEREKLRGDQVNLRWFYAKVPAGAWLHIRIPGRGSVTTA